MEKIKQFLKKVPNFRKSILNFAKNRSISTQLIFTIVLIFASFFILQSFLNISFFRNYYTEQEFDKVHTSLMEYVDTMNGEDSNYYEVMNDFTSENNAYSVITNGNYEIIGSGAILYTLTLEDNDSDNIYEIQIPTNDYTFSENQEITSTFYLYHQNIYSPINYLDNNNEIIYQSAQTCDDVDCIEVTGKITGITQPDNLNYLFIDNSIISNEMRKINSDDFNLDNYKYETESVEGYWYKSTDGAVDTLVFVHHLKTWYRIVTIVPIVNTSDIIDIVSSYNYYVYLTAIAIIFMWSFRLSSIISKPIQNIELVAREIAALNFDEEAHEYNNKENASLSSSINLISSNLKNTLETINSKNKELLDLYEEQSNQVSLKKQLVSSISHELKTPLMIMQVTIQGILDGIIDPEDQDEELLNVIEEINKSSLMIQDMLQIYRLDDANTQLEISEFNLSNVVRYFVDDFETTLKQYNFNLDINVEDNVYVEADEKLIKRVISNFITNAIKYTPKGEKIYIEVSKKMDKIHFELTNYGVSIKKEEIDKIWLPFYRLEQKDASRIRSKGSGIGLYLVSEILKAHDAEFGIHNVKNGITAYFTLNKTRE